MVKKVTIGYLSNEIKTGIISKGNSVYKLERKEIKKIICIVLDNKAIDINDFCKQYDILKRNEYNQIVDDIKENKPYALSIDELDDISVINKIKYKRLEKKYKKCKH